MKSNKEKGFTIIELIVVVAIIAIITLIVLMNYPNAKKQLLIQRAASGLSQDIRRVESMAVSSKVTASTCGGVFPLGGYGIYFKSAAPQEIAIFADCNNNKFRDAGENVETISLEADARISSLAPASPVVIIFMPPNPVVSILGNAIEANEATIVIDLVSDAAKTKTIKVNKAGLIWIE